MRQRSLTPPILMIRDDGVIAHGNEPMMNSPRWKVYQPPELELTEPATKRTYKKKQTKEI